MPELAETTWWTRHGVIIAAFVTGLLGALGLIASALIAAHYTDRNSTLADNNGSLVSTIGDLRQTLSAQASSIASQSAENQNLRSSLSALASASPGAEATVTVTSRATVTVTPPPAASKPSVSNPAYYHTGTLVIKNVQGGRYFDLDSPPSNSTFARHDNGSLSGDDIGGWDASSFYTVGNTYYSLMTLNRPPTYEDCNSEGTSYSTGQFPHQDLTPGAYFCIKTDELRLAYIKVDSVGQSAAVIDVKVFNDKFH